MAKLPICRTWWRGGGHDIVTRLDAVELHLTRHHGHQLCHCLDEPKLHVSCQHITVHDPGCTTATEAREGGGRLPPPPRRAGLRQATIA
ncbi:hypothetical protein PR202_gb29190 [Eleusine coracana subsp. coracana]|uniref:Uncharacterized protein n=1 Tax=Eleusine coracana subsp. coracana TaxID=191504 RepID=A0AAV5FZ23_ELECO|nr:hypothetical protein PR202_gb29190 [Eleusine coracana subsp. coracana]